MSSEEMKALSTHDNEFTTRRLLFLQRAFSFCQLFAAASGDDFCALWLTTSEKDKGKKLALSTDKSSKNFFEKKASCITRGTCAWDVLMPS